MSESKLGIDVSYFLLCDIAITEAGSGKQSLIGVYSSLVTQQLPFYVNMAVGIGVRVTLPEEKKFTLHVFTPEDQQMFPGVALPCDWNALKQMLKSAPFALLQTCINLQMLQLSSAGVYRLELRADEQIIATYPLHVVKTVPQQVPAQPPGQMLN